MAANHVVTRLAVDSLKTDSSSHENDNQYSAPWRKMTSNSGRSLTPPETPVKRDSGDNSDRRIFLEDDDEKSQAYVQQQPILEFPYDLHIERENEDGGEGSADKSVEFGRGVWSVVYKASSTWSPLPSALSSSTLTPPSSPVTSVSRVLAVKTPLRPDAHSVLKAEARILSRVMSRFRTETSTTASIDAEEHEQQEGESQYVVPFYGYIPSSHSLVMQAVPLSLSNHIERCAELAKRQFSTKTMFEPVLSSAHWRDLAIRLIKGLDWLHSEVGIVHGDIKPHNILLRARPRSRELRSMTINGNSSSSSNNLITEFQYDALYTDFSSAHVISLSQDKTTALSALTPPFAAPELMTVSAMKSDEVLSTPASDIFSLALTLLAAATGDTLVYSGMSSMQRLAMSREGYRALDYVRSGPHASRVVRGGIVERVVAGGIAKEPDARVSPSEWLAMLDA